MFSRRAEGPKSVRLYFIASLIFTFLIAGIDYFTGREVTVTFFYFIPIYLATWHAGLRAGLFVAVLSGLSIFISDLGELEKLGVHIWNTSVRFCVFIAVCYLLWLRKQAEKDLAETEGQLFQLLETLPIGLFVVTSEGTPFYANRVSTEILGQQAINKIESKQLPEIYKVFRSGSQEMYPADQLPVIRALKGERCYADDMEIHRDGRVIPLHVHAAPIYGQAGEIQYAVAVFSDVSEIKRIQTELMANKENLEVGISSMKEKNEEMSLLNELTDLLHSSLTDEEAYRIARRFLERVVSGTTGGVYKIRESRNLMELKTGWGKLPKEQSFGPDDCWAVRKGQTYFSEGEDSSLCTHFPPDARRRGVCIPMIALGQIIGMIHLSKEDSLAELRKKEATLKSLSEQVAMTLSNLQLRESLRSQAIRDPLTGLFNRRYLEETLERELSRSERKGRPLSLIMMDLDHFKRFNDSYGHAAGDELLKSFGKVLSQRARKDDVACRYGGEEFLLILPECTIDNAETVAETIRKDAMTLWIQTDPAEPVVSISAGISCYPEHGDSSKGLMLTADRALYEAKSAGRNCVIKSSSVTR